MYPKARARGSRAWFVRFRRFSLVGLVCVQVGLVAWLGVGHSPISDELGHWAAGMSIWRFGRFDLYCVNPPLVRALAAVPTVCCSPKTAWARYEHRLGARAEWELGRDLLRTNGSTHCLHCLALGRCLLIPLIVLGGYVCWRWASELYGKAAGLLALSLWCFSPNVVAWSATICPDAAAAALGVAATYCFWRWLRKPDWFRAFVAGILLGLAELTKMTWILLFVVWPVTWLVFGRASRGEGWTGKFER